MMKSAIYNIFEMIVGFSTGVLVGGGYVALLIVLGVIPRAIQLLNYNRFISFVIPALLLGVLSGTYLSFTKEATNNPAFFLLFWGLFHGIFNGMIAAALVEILNVFPLLSRRLFLKDYMHSLLMALVFGKIIGSLVQWLLFI